MDANGLWHGLMDPVKAGYAPKPQPPSDCQIRILVIGAGQRGTAYANAIQPLPNTAITAVADLVPSKRRAFGARHISDWHRDAPGSRFAHWRDFIAYETARRARAAAGELVEPGVDAALVCTLDEQHAEIVTALAPLNLHLLCEKPLATTLHDCLAMYAALRGPGGQPQAIFSIGHVLRYSPHNMQLRTLLRDQQVLGDILSVEHTEPVGWWHFSHSYVRGNWRRESSTAPSLLTKACHDVDLLLWLLAAPADASTAEPPHLPITVASTGHQSAFRRARKPRAAGAATNCLACAHEPDCRYSAKRIYVDTHLRHENTGWPVNVVDPDIEELFRTQGPAAAEQRLLARLADDYSASTPPADVSARAWYGRCVWEADNDVCDDQIVTLAWEDDALAAHPDASRPARMATLHMIAHTEAQCERRGRVYGSLGEINYDSTTIEWFDFASGRREVFAPKRRGGGHGGGDAGLAEQFVEAVRAVKGQGWEVQRAQSKFVGCSLEDVVRSHALVFAAEEARREKKVVDWAAWWQRKVEAKLTAPKANGEAVA